MLRLKEKNKMETNNEKQMRMKNLVVTQKNNMKGGNR